MLMSPQPLYDCLNFIKQKNKDAKILDLPSRFSTEYLNWNEKMIEGRNRNKKLYDWPKPYSEHKG